MRSTHRQPVITQEMLDPATLTGIHKSKNAKHPVVKKYMADLKAGAEFPPIDVEVRSEGMLWVLDGEKRAAAHLLLKRDVAANVAREGAPTRVPCDAMIRRRALNTNRKKRLEDAMKKQKKGKTK